MSKIKLYIAASLDGFIARKDGSLDWLDEIQQTQAQLPEADRTDAGYTDFISTIDTVVLGRSTYEEILGFGVDWPYSSCQTFVATSNTNYTTSTENTTAIHQINDDFIHSLKKQSKKNIWIVGGGQLITHFINQNQIDEMIITVISRILGEGIPLFPNHPKDTKFELVNSTVHGKDMVNLHYKKIK